MVSMRIYCHTRLVYCDPCPAEKRGNLGQIPSGIAAAVRQETTGARNAVLLSYTDLPTLGAGLTRVYEPF